MEAQLEMPEKAQVGQMSIVKSAIGLPNWQLQRAFIYLRAMLRTGPVRSLQLNMAAGGISLTTLKRARKALGVRAYRAQNRWYCDWPRDAGGPLFQGVE
jgi:hypothetical protein